MRLILTALLLCSLLSCSKESTALTIPPATEGGWKLSSTTQIESPDWMNRLGIRSAQKARYAGPMDVEADIYELRSDAAALECTQLWKRAEGDSPFIKRNLFIVVRSSHPNREMMMDFSRALDKAL